MSAQADTNCHDIFNAVSATRTHLAKIGATYHVVPTCHDMLATFPPKAMTTTDGNINGDGDGGGNDDSNSGGGCGDDNNGNGSGGGHSKGGEHRQQSTQSGSERNGGNSNGNIDSDSNQLKAAAKETVSYQVIGTWIYSWFCEGIGTLGKVNPVLYYLMS